MKFPVENVLTYCKKVFMAVGLNEADADIASDSLVLADMRGISSHGVTRLKTYAKRIESGVIDSDTDPIVVNSSPAAKLIDGKNGIGSVVAHKTMNICMEMADAVGMCFASVYNGNHFGIGASLTIPAARKGYISIAMSNAPASVVPFGGSVPRIGTNPLSVAIPNGNKNPIVLDMATSVVAQGKIIQAKKEGISIPSGWAVSGEGKATTDPDEALKGSMLPFGGPKGYGIGLLIQILSSALSGANVDTQIPSFWNDFKNKQNLGFFLGVFKVDAFLFSEIFQERMDSIVTGIKNTPPAEGFQEVMLPGEIEFTKEKHAKRDGIELSQAIIDDLIEVGDRYSVSTDFLTNL